jgi:transcriptional regulator with XRE-family HTH domain
MLARLIGARVRFLRRRRGWTQVDLAERMDEHREIVCRIERGLHVPSLETIDLLAIALDCHPRIIVSAIDHVGVGAVDEHEEAA